MIHVNLIPAARLQRRRVQARVRVWMLAAGVYVSLLGAASLGFAVWTSPIITSLRNASDDTMTISHRLDQTTRQIALERSALVLNRNRLKVLSSIRDHPDWCSVLVLVAQRLGPAIRLDQVLLQQPAQTGSSAGAPSASPAGALDPGSFTDLWKLHLAGTADAQPEISRFTLALEAMGLFDKVTLVETRRVAAAAAASIEQTGQSASQESTGAVAFVIECVLTDPAGWEDTTGMPRASDLAPGAGSSE